jgi:hypothetical protein
VIISATTDIGYAEATHEIDVGPAFGSPRSTPAHPTTRTGSRFGSNAAAD